MSARKYKYLVGVDEAGRGPLCGPVVAAAAVLKRYDSVLLSVVTDSKKLSEKKRLNLVPFIKEKCYFAYGSVSAQQIDEINIYQAAQLAFKRALDRLFAQCSIDPEQALVIVDGNAFLHKEYDHKCVIKGDLKVPIVSAASILAKVRRDTWMGRYDRLYPQYGIAKHKGYPTKAHREKIKEFGPAPIYRRSFKLLQGGI